jgi:hypothetical protein
MHIFKGFEDQSDTYHDTWTHYLMEQDPSLLQDQAKVTDVVAADKVEVLKNEKMGPPGPCSSRFGSRYSMSNTCGPRDIISLVIPKLGDNMALKWEFELNHDYRNSREWTLQNHWSSCSSISPREDKPLQVMAHKAWTS